MNKNQAYTILNNAISSIQTTRQNHEILMNALSILLGRDVKPDQVKADEDTKKKPQE